MTLYTYIDNVDTVPYPFEWIFFQNKASLNHVLILTLISYVANVVIVNLLYSYYKILATRLHFLKLLMFTLSKCTRNLL